MREGGKEWSWWEGEKVRQSEAVELEEGKKGKREGGKVRGREGW